MICPRCIYYAVRDVNTQAWEHKCVYFNEKWHKLMFESSEGGRLAYEDTGGTQKRSGLNHDIAFPSSVSLN